MRLRRDRAIEIKSPEQLGRMRGAGLVVASTLRVLTEAVRPGITTADLDEIAAKQIRAAGAVPSFLGYFGYPATICTSVNEEIVHGIPSENRRLEEGDIISIDCGAILDGWHGDAAISLGVGDIDPADQALLDACSVALWRGIAAATSGHTLSDISHAVEQSVRASGNYGLIREYTGHGIGTEMHMEPAVPNFGPPGRGPQLRAGMALAIEPMITRGGRFTRELADGWTVVAADGSRAAHFEHTVAITANGPWVLTEALGADDELARGDGGLARRDDELARGDGGLARRDDELARGNDELARGDDELARGDDPAEPPVRPLRGSPRHHVSGRAEAIREQEIAASPRHPPYSADRSPFEPDGAGGDGDGIGWDGR